MSSYLKHKLQKKTCCNVSNAVFAGYIVNEDDAFYHLTVCLEKGNSVASTWRPESYMKHAGTHSHNT